MSARYEQASVIVTSKKPFSRWSEVFGNDTLVAAIIHRLVHYAAIADVKRDSYGLEDRDLGCSTTASTSD